PFRNADRGVQGSAQRRCHSAGRAAVRRSAGRTCATASGLLVPLLSILGRPTGRARRPAYAIISYSGKGDGSLFTNFEKRLPSPFPRAGVESHGTAHWRKGCPHH